MNQEQIKSAIRSLITTFGGGIAGWFAAKGWFTIDQVTSVLNSPTTISILASIAAGAWGLISHTQTNAIAVVDSIAQQPNSPVKAVINKDTPEGRNIAAALPGNTTVVEGSQAAAAVAT